MPSENGKDEALLRELREISNRHSRYNQSKEPQRPLSAASSPAADEKENTENGATPDREGRDFLRRTRENPALNQYWYSEGTARALLGGVREALALSPRGGARVAFLSTPSLYFALDPEERARGALFDVRPRRARRDLLAPPPFAIRADPQDSPPSAARRPSPFPFAVRRLVGVLRGLPFLRLQRPDQRQRRLSRRLRRDYHGPPVHFSGRVGKICHHGTPAGEGRWRPDNSDDRG